MAAREAARARRSRCAVAADADAGRSARHRRRRDRAQRQDAGPSMSLDRRSPRTQAASGLSAEAEFNVDPHDLSLRRPCRAGARRSPRPAASTSSAIWCAYDVGRAVNPMLVEGQIVGGVAQGIGGALLEEFLYDESGEPLSRHLRRLPDADRARSAAGRCADHRGCAEPAQSARPQRRRRRRHQRRSARRSPPRSTMRCSGRARSPSCR